MNKRIVGIVMLLISFLVPMSAECGTLTLEKADTHKTAEQYRIERQQLERMRRDLLFTVGRNPVWIKSKDQVEQVVKTVMMIDATIVELYLDENADKEQAAQEKEYADLKGERK